ncbi:prenylated flavin chaperone LpdD [Candidatus Hodarchaeum mangrovi]
MKEIFRQSTKFKEYVFNLRVYLKGQDLIVNIEGPNDHLGGIGVGVPYLRITGEKSANYHIFSLPHHRDAEVAGILARTIAKITQRNIIVLFGIHLQSPTKEEIKEIIEFLELWVTRWSKEILIFF